MKRILAITALLLAPTLHAQTTLVVGNINGMSQVVTDLYVVGTATLQSAITAACAESPVARVIVPAGALTISAPVTVPANCNLTLSGASRYLSFINASSGFSGTCTDSTNAVLCTQTGDNLRVEHLSINGGGYVNTLLDVQSPGATSLTLSDNQMTGYKGTGILIYDLQYLTVKDNNYLGNYSALCTGTPCRGLFWQINAVAPTQVIVDGSTFDQSQETTYNFFAFGIFGSATANLPVGNIQVSNSHFLFPNLDLRESDGLVLGLTSLVGAYPAQFLQGAITNTTVTGLGGYTSANVGSGFSFGMQLSGFQNLAVSGGGVYNADKSLYIENCPTNDNISVTGMTIDTSSFPGWQYAGADAFGIFATVASENTTSHVNPCVVTATGNTLNSQGYNGSAIRSGGWSKIIATGNLITNWYRGAFLNGNGSSFVGNTVNYTLGTSAGSGAAMTFNTCDNTGTICPSPVTNITMDKNVFQGNAPYGIYFNNVATYSGISRQENVISSAITTPYSPAQGTAGFIDLDTNGANFVWHGSPILNFATNVPAWLQNLGNGADGAGACSGTAYGEYYYTTFNVALGNTCTIIGGGTALIIHATGACTINGTIIGQTSSGTYPVGGGGAGGSGGGTLAAAASTGTYYIPANAVSANASTAGAAGAASGGAGGAAGGTANQNAQRIIYNSGAGVDGALLGGGKSGSGGSGGDAGVNGGGGLVLICGSITGTGTINLSGNNGNNATGNNTGPSAGGGGGVFIASSQAPETFGLTVNVAGGSAGSCLSYTGCGAAQAGANGWYTEVLGW